ncbi:MAG: hypothetical protein E7607_08425 [Ruminococcaceae bacterium]|nr:hypothetical protein [Oscillospiraceae bacterium]
MNEYVRMKASAMKKINDLTLSGEIVIFGSTYMSEFPIYELTNKCKLENAVYNRSIKGLTVKEAIEILDDCVVDIHPSKVFIALGEEDESDPNAASEYSRLISTIRQKLPEAMIYMIGLTNGGSFAEKFNKNMLSLCDNKTVKYIDLIKKSSSESALFKAQFKQLSCFFRTHPITMSDVFSLASL